MKSYCKKCRKAVETTKGCKCVKCGTKLDNICSDNYVQPPRRKRKIKILKIEWKKAI